nr:protein kinase [Aeromicrobium duanguangcaii]
MSDTPTKSIRRSLPSTLVDEYEIESLIGRGNQAEVYRCRHTPSGDVVAIKLYTTPNHRLNDDVIRLIEAASDEHVIRTRFGQHGDEQWEIQEHAAFGTLTTLPEHPMVTVNEEFYAQIVRELTAAVQHSHSAGLIHRDVKPSNVLVRGLDPIDLVLADFGLARELMAGAEAGSSSHGRGYGSPEALQGVHGFPSDWWAVGITLLEVRQGRYPFADAEGRRWTEARIFAHLMSNDVDVSGLDGRWQILIRGLLTKDPQQRWGGDQVQRWLAGESPAVHRGTVDTTPTKWQLVAPNWGTFDSPEAVGHGLIDQWQAAGAFLSGRGRTATRNALARTAHAEAVHALFDLHDRGSLSTNALLFDLSRQLAPGREPTFRGHELSSENLISVGSRAANGDADAADWIRRLREDHILQLAMGHPEHRKFVETDAIVTQWWTELEQLSASLLGAQESWLRDQQTGDETPALRSVTAVVTDSRDRIEGELLSAALDYHHAAELHARSRSTEINRDTAGWLDQLRSRRQSGSHPPSDLLLILLAPAAATDGRSVASAIRAQRNRERSERSATIRANRAGQARAGLWPKVWLGVLYSVGGFVAFVVSTSAGGPEEIQADLLRTAAQAVAIGLAVGIGAAVAADALVGRPSTVALAVLFPLGFWLGWEGLSEYGSLYRWGDPLIGAGTGYLVAAVATWAIRPWSWWPTAAAEVTGRTAQWGERLSLCATVVLPLSVFTMLWDTSPETRMALGVVVAELQADAWPWLGSVYDVFNEYDHFFDDRGVWWAIPSGLALFTLLAFENTPSRTWLELALLTVTFVAALVAVVFLWPLYLTGVIMISGVVLVLGIGAFVLSNY